MIESKHNNNYKFILTVIDIFTKYAWAIPLNNKFGLSTTHSFKIVLAEYRKTEIYGYIEVASFTIKHLTLYLENMKLNYILITVI